MIWAMLRIEFYRAEVFYGLSLRFKRRVFLFSREFYGPNDNSLKGEKRVLLSKSVGTREYQINDVNFLLN